MATTPTHALETLPLRAGMARAALLSLLVACVGAVSTGPIALQHRVCIFDFDDTIKMDDDSVARGAKYVVDACAARGYKLGLATAGCSTSYAKKYLAQRVDPDQWTPDVLNSQAFQSCQPVKRYSIPPILQHYGIAVRLMGSSSPSLPPRL